MAANPALNEDECVLQRGLDGSPCTPHSIAAERTVARIISPSRMRSVSEARNGFNSLIADAEEELTTHVVKGSTIVAYIVPRPPRSSMIPSCASRSSWRSASRKPSPSASRNGGTTWFRRQAIHGKPLVVGLEANLDLSIRTFAQFHSVLQEALGQQIG